MDDNVDATGRAIAEAGAMMRLNLVAPTVLSIALLPLLEQARSGRGAIVNVSSVAGFYPLPQASVYCATKAGLTSLGEGLASWCRRQRHGVRVVSICPGPLVTEGWQHEALARRGRRGRLLMTDVDTIARLVERAADGKGPLVVTRPRWYRLASWLPQLSPRLWIWMCGRPR